MEKEIRPRRRGGRGVAYRAFASSLAKALRGDCSLWRPPRFRRSGGRCCGGVRTALGGTTAGCGPRASLPFGGCAALARKQPVFQRGAIEAANDGLHLVVGGRFDKCEALGFLGFVVADHLDGVGHQIFGGQPLPDVTPSIPWRWRRRGGRVHPRRRIGSAPMKWATTSSRAWWWHAHQPVVGLTIAGIAMASACRSAWPPAISAEPCAGSSCAPWTCCSRCPESCWRSQCCRWPGIVQNGVMAMSFAVVPHVRLVAACADAAQRAVRGGGDRRGRDAGSSASTSCPTRVAADGAGDIHMRLGDAGRGIAVLHRRRHTAEHSEMGQHHCGGARSGR